MLSCRSIVAAGLLLVLTACGGSPYRYHVEPTPLQKGKTLYVLGDVMVNLTLGHGANPDDKQFASQDELTESFKTYLLAQLETKKILASDAAQAGAVINLVIDYERRFNYGGNSLNKPKVSFVATITKDDQDLASFGQAGFTTTYGTFKDMAVNLEIASSNWDAEDEPQDIELISKTIVDDVFNLGR